MVAPMHLQTLKFREKCPKVAAKKCRQGNNCPDINILVP